MIAEGFARLQRRRSGSALEGQQISDILQIAGLLQRVWRIAFFEGDQIIQPRETDGEISLGITLDLRPRVDLVKEEGFPLPVGDASRRKTVDLVGPHVEAEERLPLFFFGGRIRIVEAFQERHELFAVLRMDPEIEVGPSPPAPRNTRRPTVRSAGIGPFPSPAFEQTEGDRTAVPVASRAPRSF